MYHDNPEYKEILENFDVDELIGQMILAHDITIVHDKDPDGYTSAAMMYHFIQKLELVNLQSPVRRIPIAHGRAFQEEDLSTKIPFSDVLVVLDQACDEEKIEELKKLCHHLLIVDHHPESINLKEGEVSPYIGLKGNVTKVVVMGFSTCALVDLFLRSYVKDQECLETYQVLSEIVNHYDTWRFGQNPAYDRTVKAFTATFFHYGDEAIPWDAIVSDKEGEGLKVLNQVVVRGESILDVKQRQVQNILKNRVIKRKFLFGGVEYTAGIVYHTDSYDELGSEMLKQYNDIDFALIVALVNDAEKNHRLYLRSNDSRADCSVFARYLGGGGHRNACGATVSARTYFVFFNLL